MSDFPRRPLPCYLLEVCWDGGSLTRARTRARTHTHTRTHARTHAHTHTHTHTRKQANTQTNKRTCGPSITTTFTSKVHAHQNPLSYFLNNTPVVLCHRGARWCLLSLSLSVSLGLCLSLCVCPARLPIRLSVCLSPFRHFQTSNNHSLWQRSKAAPSLELKKKKKKKIKPHPEENSIKTLAPVAVADHHGRGGWWSVAQ